MSAARRRHTQRHSQKRQTVGATHAAAPPPVSHPYGFGLPLTLTLSLLLVSFVPRIQSNITLSHSFWAAAAGLLLWQAILYVRSRTAAERRSLRLKLRPQHYLQASVQLAVFLYWGYFWRPVYDYAWLLVGQLLFAYVFDLLLSWSRRDSYTLGFGPFPIIFSTNLFLWFRDDWFYLQFLMLAAGFMGKEFVRWRRGEAYTHVFNPSAFSLGLFSLVLIATDTTSLTWGQDIATTLTLAPNIYLFLFFIGLVVMYFFSITLIAGSAAVVLFGASALYSALTGVPYFIDSEIPSAVFLGLHLLVTDPSTSPRTPIGKALFGMLYGLGVFGLYALLGSLGVPTFYDKLLCVPLLNLSVKWLERLASAIQTSIGFPRQNAAWSPASTNLVHMTVWVLFFATMTAAGSTDGRHRGDAIPFWQQACADNRSEACARLIQLESNYCGDNAGWACNELGVHYLEGVVVDGDQGLARTFFSQACELRFQAGCLNLLNHDPVSRPPPRALDLRLLLREGGPNLLEMPERELYDRACQHGWTFACPSSTAP